MSEWDIIIFYISLITMHVIPFIFDLNIAILKNEKHILYFEFPKDIFISSQYAIM